MGMEKYGQKADDPGQDGKVASGKVQCPECGAECEVHGQTIICPKHGTKPFVGKAKQDD